MRVSQQLLYSLHGVFDLAYHGRDGPVRIQEISERQGIPTRYLEQIFQKLRRAGLIASKRGPGGGYLLARPADEITLADVTCALQGEVLTCADPDGTRPGGDFVWEALHGGVREALERCTIATLCRHATEQGIARDQADPAMYEI